MYVQQGSTYVQLNTALPVNFAVVVGAADGGDDGFLPSRDVRVTLLHEEPAAHREDLLDGARAHWRQECCKS